MRYVVCGMRYVIWYDSTRDKHVRHTHIFLLWKLQHQCNIILIKTIADGVDSNCLTVLSQQIGVDLKPGCENHIRGPNASLINDANPRMPEYILMTWPTPACPIIF